MAILALSHSNCGAQGFPNVFSGNTLKPRVVYERDLKNALGNDFKTGGALVRGTLTRSGSDLLLNDPLNSQIIVVDTKTLAESTIPLELPAIDVKIDSETDMLFVETLNQIESDDSLSSQTCYESLARLRNREPQWMFGRSEIWQQIRWLKDHQRFIIFSPGTDQLMVLLDNNGVKVGEQKIHGQVLGVDEDEGGFSIFHLVNHRGTNQLMLSQFDNEWKVGRSQKLPVVDRPQNPGVSTLGISQSFRLRGLKSGEVTKYFLNIATQQGYLEMRGRLPIANLTSRFYYANKLSAAESTSQPEIIVGLSADRRHFADGFFLFDRQSNFYYDPDQWLTDAIFDDERKLIVTVGSSTKPRHRTVRLISFE